MHHSGLGVVGFGYVKEPGIAGRTREKRDCSTGTRAMSFTSTAFGWTGRPITIVGRILFRSRSACPTAGHAARFVLKSGT
jgi:hypothetical protein